MLQSTRVCGDSALGAGPPPCDVSVVLNIHRESTFLQTTLLSLSACALFARNQGLRIELVAVFDRSDNVTRGVFLASDTTAFESVTATEIDVGSLGEARNAGIALARGEFIWTSDADDLVSANCIPALLSAAMATSDMKTVVFCEYCIGFGERNFIGRYERSSLICAADFATLHPYVSRLFIHRSAFKELRFRDLKLSKGFAYEDWDLNAQLFARGYYFDVAPETAFFYRQRPDSLLQQAERQSARMIPHCELFEPDHFARLMRQKRTENKDWGKFLAARSHLHELDFRNELFSSPVLRQAIIEATKIDPEIAPLELERAPSYCPIPWDQSHWGFSLEEAFELVGNRKFSDVILLPWLLPGGAEKQILEVVGSICSREEDCHVLVLTGERVDTIGWQDRLGSSYVFLDLFNAFPAMEDKSRDELTARLLLSTCKEKARLHFKPSIFAHRLLDRFAAALSDHFETIYYRFCDNEFFWRGTHVRDPYGVCFLRRHLTQLSSVIYDSLSLLERDVAILPPLRKTAHCVHTVCRPNSLKPLTDVPPQFRLLWASRITKQKRPDLIKPLSTALFRRVPQVSLSVYGAVDDGLSLEHVVRGGKAEYMGGFESFDKLPVQRFDALVYTSAYDGIPNILLEAMISGLTVIAPDIGGISEVVTPDTGFIFANSDSVSILVNRYVDAVVAMYEDWESTLAKRKAARSLIMGRHDPDTFNRAVASAISSPDNHYGSVSGFDAGLTARTMPANVSLDPLSAGSHSISSARANHA